MSLRPDSSKSTMAIRVPSQRKLARLPSAWPSTGGRRGSWFQRDAVASSQLMPSAVARVIAGSRARVASSGYRRLMYATHWRCFQVRCGSAAATSAGTL